MKAKVAEFIDTLIGGGCEKLEHVGACGLCSDHITIPLTRNYWRWYTLGEHMEWDGQGHDQRGQPAAREIRIPNVVLHKLWDWATDNYDPRR